MQAIILFSHGSVLCGAGENLAQLARTMRERGDAPIVEVGYLNYSEPTFEAAFEACVTRGATRIMVAPYFLIAGYFVEAKLPPKIAAMREQFPHVPVSVGQAMKSHPLLAQALLSCAARAQPPRVWRDYLDTVPQFCRANPSCPLFDTPRCPATAGRTNNDN